MPFGFNRYPLSEINRPLSNLSLKISRKRKMKMWNDLYFKVFSVPIYNNKRIEGGENVKTKIKLEKRNRNLRN